MNLKIFARGISALGGMMMILSGLYFLFYGNPNAAALIGLGLAGIALALP